MTRYLRQKDEFHCGPVAIINAMKWVGINASARSHLNQLSKECGTDKYGTYPQRFGRVLSKYVRAHYWERPFTPGLKNHLSFGRAFVLGHSFVRNDDIVESHYTLCIGRDSGGYIMVNDVHTYNGEIIKPTVCYKGDAQFKEMVYGNPIRAEAWLI